MPCRAGRQTHQPPSPTSPLTAATTCCRARTRRRSGGRRCGAPSPRPGMRGGRGSRSTAGRRCGTPTSTGSAGRRSAWGPPTRPSEEAPLGSFSVVSFPGEDGAARPRPGAHAGSRASDLLQPPALFLLLTAPAVGLGWMPAWAPLQLFSLVTARLVPRGCGGPPLLVLSLTSLSVLRRRRTPLQLDRYIWIPPMICNKQHAREVADVHCAVLWKAQRPGRRGGTLLGIPYRAALSSMSLNGGPGLLSSDSHGSKKNIAAGSFSLFVNEPSLSAAWQATPGRSRSALY